LPAGDCFSITQSEQEKKLGVRRAELSAPAFSFVRLRACAAEVSLRPTWKFDIPCSILGIPMSTEGNSPPRKLILASRSPRRRELLTEAGYDFEIIEPSDAAENEAEAIGDPASLAKMLAYRKAADVAARCPVGIVIGCDTIVECRGAILGKPADQSDARRMLTTLSGQEHRVLSGLCLWPRPQGEPKVGLAQTRLKMDALSMQQLEDYVASGQWEGKAGAFGYQDRLGWVHVIEGSESNVVGLPMELLAEMLEESRVQGRESRAG
jgi:septum formation protein